LLRPAGELCGFLSGFLGQLKSLARLFVTFLCQTRFGFLGPLRFLCRSDLRRRDPQLFYCLGISTPNAAAFFQSIEF
jgi:hypothetical protein